MHRLFTAAALVVSTGLISLSADARPIEVRELNVKSTVGKTEESVEPKHKDWINLNRVTLIRWAPGVESRNVRIRGRLPVSRDRRGSGLATGKRQHRPFTVIKPIDKASPLLARLAKTGRPLPAVVLVARNSDTQDAGRQPYLKIKLENVQIARVQTGSSRMERVTLKFSRVELP